MRPGFLGLLLLASVAFAPAIAGAEKKQLRVVTTFLPAFCFASNVGGDLVRVENLLPGGVSLHEYQLSGSELRRLSQADLIVANGLGMETFIEKAIAVSGAVTEKKIVRLSDGLESELIEDAEPHHHHEPGHDHQHNPHIWLDPKLAVRGVRVILNALKTRVPEHADQFEKNANAYIERLQAMDSEFEETLSEVKGVPFITYHNAFPYFVRRYGLRLAGVVEKAPEVLPTLKERSKLQATIREQKVKALFAEPGVKSSLARDIARDTGIALAALDPLETGALTRDSYEAGMRRNVATLLETLSQ